MARHPEPLDTPFKIAFALAWLAALLPIWCVRFLPLIDLPNHLASIGLWHHLDDPAWGHQPFYEYSRQLAPYWGYYLPVHALAYLMPIEVANKVYLSLYAASLPASLVVLGRRFGRSPWMALPAFVLVWNFSVGWGFISFAAGLPVMLLALAALDALLQAPSPSRFVACFALTLATYFMHPLPRIFLGLAAALALARALLDGPAGRRAAALASAALLPSVGCAIVNLKLAQKPATHMLVDATNRLTPGYEKFVAALGAFPDRLLIVDPHVPYRIALVAFAISLALLAATARRTPRPVDESRLPDRRLHALLPLAWALLALIAYFKAPIRLFHPISWWNISPRFATLFAMLVLVAVPGRVAGWRRFVVVPALIAALVYPIALARRFAAFDARAAGFAHLMEKVPRGSSTLFMSAVPNMGKPDLTGGLYFFNFNGYAQLIAGGYNPFGFKDGFPVRDRPNAALPAPRWSDRWGNYSQPKYGAYYDYVITQGEPTDHALFAGYATRVPLIGHDGEWRLYRTRDIR